VNIVNKRDIERLIETDSKFASIHDKFGSPPDWTRPQGFISLSQIILEQQLSLASAKAHFLKLSNYLPGFTPANILKLTDAEMRNCQISRQKALYLRSLSAAILNGDLNLRKLSKLEEPEVRRQLTGIKGIGNWTADIYLMFCLQSKDIFPVGDIAIVNTIRELYNVKTGDEILSLAEKWKPVRSLAAYFFWHYYLGKRKKSNDNFVPPIP
jgi:DNA-3-methyladenine glycosylase II